MDRLELTFGRRGTRLVWTVSDGRDEDDYADCSKKPYYTLKRKVGNRLVYYARGNHGDSAWTCFSSRTKSGYRQPIGIDLWIGNDPGRPSSLTAIRMVASPRGMRPLPPRPGSTSTTTPRDTEDWFQAARLHRVRT
jgi:hypothetical protein